MLLVTIGLLVVVVLILVIEKLTAGSDGKGCFSNGLYFIAATLICFAILDSCSNKSSGSSTQNRGSESSSDTGFAQFQKNSADEALVGHWENSEESFILDLNPAGAGWALTYIASDLNVYQETGSKWLTIGSAVSLTRDSGTVFVKSASGREWNEAQPQGSYDFSYTVFQYGQLRLSSDGAEPIELFRK